jgi:hypothetical protein
MQIYFPLPKQRLKAKPSIPSKPKATLPKATLPNAAIFFTKPSNFTCRFNPNIKGYYTLNASPTQYPLSSSLSLSNISVIRFFSANITSLNIQGVKNINLSKLLLPTSLVLLYCPGCELKTLPDLSKLTNLVELEYSNNLITVVDIKKLPLSLKYLGVSYCLLKDPPDLSTFTLLNELNYSGNKFINQLNTKKLPPSLLYLAISNCNLKTLPDFSKFENLIYLGCSYNYNLGKGANMNIKNLPLSLEVLEISNCFLKDPPDLSTFTRLNYLAYSNNPFINQLNIKKLPTSLIGLEIENCNLKLTLLILNISLFL